MAAKAKERARRYNAARNVMSLQTSESLRGNYVVVAIFECDHGLLRISTDRTPRNGLEYLSFHEKLPVLLMHCKSRVNPVDSLHISLVQIPHLKWAASA